ncbi:MAG: hypothetical protein ACE5KE_14540 [Methanosarcinales archaeon]
MGVNFPCGCRVSAGNYFPCPYHKDKLEDDWERFEYDKDFLKEVQEKNEKYYERLREVV